MKIQNKFNFERFEFEKYFLRSKEKYHPSSWTNICKVQERHLSLHLGFNSQKHLLRTQVEINPEDQEMNPVHLHFTVEETVI